MLIRFRGARALKLRTRAYRNLDNFRLWAATKGAHE